VLDFPELDLFFFYV